MSSANPALIVRVVGNIEELKKDLGEGVQVLKQTTTEMEHLGSTATTAAVRLDAVGAAAGVTTEVFEKMPSLFARARGGLNDVADAAGITVGNLGLVDSAGLAIGVGYAAWKITRIVMDFFELDAAVEKSWTSLLKWGDVAAQTAGAKADELARASKRAGREISDFNEAVAINAKVVKDWNDDLARARAPEEFAQQIRDWHAEIQKVTDAGVLESLKAGLKSGAISVNELSASYRISVGAINLFKRELAETAAIEKTVAEERTKLAREAAAEAAKQAAFLEEFSVKTHKNAMHQVTEFAAARAASAAIVNAAVLAEFDAQTQLNAAQGRDAAGAIALQVTAAGTLQKALDALHGKKVEGISQAAQEQVLMDAFTQALYDEAVALDTSTAGLSAAKPAADALAGGISHADQTAKQFTNTLVLGVMNLETFNREVSKFYDSFGSEFGTAAGTSAGIPGSSGVGSRRVAGARAEGGPVDAGRSYVVGERGPEVFTPRSAGTIQANSGGGAGSGGGGSTVIQLVVDGRVLAAVVNGHNDKTLMQGRQWPAR